MRARRRRDAPVRSDWQLVEDCGRPAWEYAPVTMHRRAWLLLLALVLLAAPGVSAARTRHHLSAVRVRPHTFASCAQLVGYARHRFAVTRGVPEPAVAPLAGSVAPTTAAGGPATGAPGESGAPNVSTTNNQEPGVDEPDIVKTDGATIFAVVQGTLFAVDVHGGMPKLAGRLSLGATGYGAQLVVHRHRLIVISSGFATPVAIGVPGRRSGQGARSIRMGTLARRSSPR